MTAGVLPGDSWLSLLIRLSKVSEIFVGCAVENGCTRYLDHAKRVSQYLQALKRHSEKANRQNNYFIKRTQPPNTLTPQAATTDHCAAPYNHLNHNPVGVLPGGPLHMEEIAIRAAVELSSAGLCCAVPYYMYDLALRTMLCHPRPLL